MDALKSIFMKNFVTLGKKKAEIRKLTPADWKLVFGSFDKLPSLIVTIMQAPKEQQSVYLVEGIDLALDEVIEITSKLTGIEEDYLTNQVGLDELVEYFALTIKKNRLDTLPKNLKSLLQGQM